MAPPRPPAIEDEEALFTAAVELPLSDRAALISARCPGDADLQRRVEALLHSHAARGFMELDTDPGTDPSRTGEAPVAEAERPGDRIGRYRLIESIGQGGFGTVWKAEQVEPVRRLVALKIIKLGMDTGEVVARFDQERRALAMMDHPSIAKVFDAGATGLGRPFFVMELFPGERITDFCDNAGLSVEDRLALFIRVGQALQHAHQKGIIHRDLKPSNILVRKGDDGTPQPKIIDFGLAKATDPGTTEAAALTALQAVLGTPAYMSPEQAETGSRDVDTRSDIYSLGVVLYELLTGSTPFDRRARGTGRAPWNRETPWAVDPPRPSARLAAMEPAAQEEVARGRRGEVRQLLSLLRKDLDWIVMCCLEKDRSRRYGTATALAEDVQRFLAHEPVMARPPAAAYRFARLLRRRRGTVAAVGAVACALVLGTGVSIWQAVRVGKEKREALNQSERAGRGEALAKAATQQLQDRLVEAAQTDRVSARHLADQGRVRDAVTFLARACEFAPDESLAAEQAIGIGNANAFPVPSVLALGPKCRIAMVRFSPDGSRILGVPTDLPPRLWDAKTGAPAAVFQGHAAGVRWMEFSPDGRRLVSGGEDGTARLWDTGSGGEIRRLDGHTLDVQCARFSPDGSRIATASSDGTARIWDGGSGACLVTLTGHRGDVNTVEFDASGDRVLTASDDATAGVWDAVTGRRIAAMEGHGVGPDTISTLLGNEADVNTARFSPDGRIVVTASNDNTCRVWEAASGSLLRILRGHRDRVRSAEFSPDGSFVLSSSEDMTARVWNADSGETIQVLSGHQERLRAARFSPDGRRIVTASDDRTARIWETASGRLIAELAGHGDRVWDAQFDGQVTRCLTGSEDGNLRIWDLTRSQLSSAFAGHRRKGWHGQFSPDASLIVTITGEPEAAVAPDQAPSLTVNPEDLIWDAQFSPDGLRLLTAGGDEAVAWAWNLETGALQLALTAPMELGFSDAADPGLRSRTAMGWAADSGRFLFHLAGQSAALRSFDFDTTSTRLVTSAKDPTARVWDLKSGRLAFELPGDAGHLRSSRFSPDGTRIVSASEGGSATVWDAATGRSLFTLSGHTGKLRNAQFSPNGKRILTTGEDLIPRVWDAADGVLVAALTGHQLSIRTAEFSPAGTHVLTGSDDKTAALWDATSGQRLRVFAGHLARVRSARFNPAMTLALTASDDGLVRVWDIASGQRLCLLSWPDTSLRSARFSPDGTRILAAGSGGLAVVFELLGASTPPPDWFSGFLRVLVAGTLNSNGELEAIPAGTLAAMRKTIEPMVKTDPSRYGAIARYYLTPGSSKPVRPGSQVTCGMAADLLIAPDASRVEIERAYEFDPSHPLVRLALARFEESPLQARLLREYDLDRIARDQSAAMVLRAVDLLDRQPGQEQVQLGLLERAEAVASGPGLSSVRQRKEALLLRFPGLR